MGTSNWTIWCDIEVIYPIAFWFFILHTFVKFQGLPNHCSSQIIEVWSFSVWSIYMLFRLETYYTSKNSQSKVGKQIRFSATTSLNLNVSAANLETLTETIVSWGRQNDVEHKSSKKVEVLCAVNLTAYGNLICFCIFELILLYFLF